MFTLYWDGTEKWANIFYIVSGLSLIKLFRRARFGLCRLLPSINFCRAGRRKSECIKTDNTITDKNIEMWNNYQFSSIVRFFIFWGGEWTDRFHIYNTSMV